MPQPRAAFFPKADATVLRSKHKPPSPSSRPTTVSPILDGEHANVALDAWSIDIAEAVYPEKVDIWAPATIPSRETRPRQCVSARYLFPVLTRDERLRLTMFFYYTRDALEDQELMSRLQEKVILAKETVGWEFVIAGLLNHNNYTRMVTVGLPLAVLPRRESTCAHTVNQPPGTVFSLLNMIEDWRFENSPHVELGGLRAYAGVPLRFETESGQHIAFGSLCVASNSPQAALSQEQQRSLARLADWIVADIIHSARSRRQRERERMQNALNDISSQFGNGINIESAIVEMLATIYPNTSVQIHRTDNGHILLDGTTQLDTSELQHGLWEDSESFDHLIETSNHETMIAPKPVRVIAAQCASQITPTFLTIASHDFRNVFDDIDSWFVHISASLLCRYWQNRALEEALAAKETFLRGITHQLRTPIHGILGSVELLTEELKIRNVLPMSLASSPSVTPDVEQMDPHAYIRTIRTSARDLISTVNSLIKLNQWTEFAQAARNVKLHTISEVVSTLLNEIKPFVPENSEQRSSLIIQHDFPTHCDTIATDLRLFIDCVQPLLLNAIQHTPRGIVVATISTNEDMRYLSVDIQDNGCGIAPKNKGFIFDAYGKVDAHSANAGLGLTLACKSAKLLNGHVSLVSSTLGEGSHFRAVFNDPVYASSYPRASLLKQNPTRLPKKYHSLLDVRSHAGLISKVGRYLMNNGFSWSGTIEDALVLFEYPADFSQLHRTLSRIPEHQVAICLVPEYVNCIFHFDQEQIRREKNIIYVQGPIYHELLEHALLQAEVAFIELTMDTGHTSTCIDEVNGSVPSELTALPDPELEVSKVQQTRSIEGALVAVPGSLHRIREAELTTSVQSLKLQTTQTTLPKDDSRKAKPKALLVDDNAVNLRLLELYCKRRGMPYCTAKDGAESVQIFQQHQEISDVSPFDLILMDLQMPICDGISATRQIRRLEQEYGWRKSIICIVTGQDSANDRANATEAGSDWYLVKPVGPKVLDRWVKEWFPGAAD